MKEAYREINKKTSVSNNEKELLDSFANGIAIFHGNLQSKMTPILCNEKLPMLLGIDHNEFYSHMSAENGYAIHPDDLDPARATLLDAVQSGTSVRQIFRLLNGKGEYRYVTVFSNVHRFEDGSYDLYCIFSDADESEQFHRIQELRHRQFQQKLIQATEKNEAYVLLNITENTCVYRYQTHTQWQAIKEKQTAVEVLLEIADDIATEKVRKEFCEKFCLEAFDKDIKEGIVAKEMRLPFYREGTSAQWYHLKSELSFDPGNGDIEIFITFTDIDNEVRLEYAMDRLLDDEYEYICHIDVKSGLLTRMGATTEDGFTEANNGKIRYDYVLPLGIKKLLPEEYQEAGVEGLRLSRILEELEKKKVYNTVFPVVIEDGKGNRLCQWRCEYLDSSHETILMCRKNISSYLDYGYDSLTGLLGRKGFYREVRKVLNENPGRRYFLAETDFDNFSLVNEEKGYAEGSRFLRQFGADIHKKLRSKSKEFYISHYEGDHFAFLCSLEYLNKPEELYDIFASQVEAYPETFRLKLRMGVYVISDKSLPVELMSDCANLALRACKGKFDRHINYYSEDLKDKMLDQQLLASEMQYALDAEQFEIWFQPQINHSNQGALIGAEALVRWNHPKRGMISPAIFIPLFEQNGFVYELDKYVWRHVCKYIRGWLDEGQKPLPIAVNISRLDILHNDFLDTIVSIVNEYSIPYELIHLEVTESAFSDNTGKVMEMTKKLIDMGFVLAIDDFGSGYSSLSMLKSVPAQILKLDMRFFADEENATRNECVIESIIRMAKMLGMSVLAEGVERIEQANLLRTVGCDYIQGYLYSKPLKYDDYMDYVDNAYGEVIHRKDVAPGEDIGAISAKNQELYRGIISGTNDIIIVADVNTKQLLYANRAAEQYYGKGFDPIKMTTCCEFCDKPVMCDDCHARSLKLGEKSEMLIEDKGRHMKAMYTRMEWNGHDAVVFYMVDISSEIKEKELADSLIRNIPGAIVAFSLNENDEPEVSYVSQRARKVFALAGVTKEDLVFEDFIGVVHPDDQKRIQRAAKEDFASKKAFHEEFRLVLADNGIMWIELTANPVADRNGKYQFFGIYTDITERRNTQGKVDEIIQSIPSAMTIYAINSQGMSRIFISDSAKKILGAREDTHDRVPMDVVYSRIHAEDRDRIREITMECIATKMPFSLQFRVEVEKNKYRWVQLDSTPIIRSEDECYFYSIYTDIHAKMQVKKDKKKIEEILSTQEKVNQGLREALLQPSPEASIDYILGFVGKAIGSERTFIFEKNQDGTDSNTFEWVAEGVLPQKDNLQNVPRSISEPWYEHFRNHDAVVIERLEDIKDEYPKIYDILVPQNVDSLVAAPFFDNHGEPVGFFGVDNPAQEELLKHPVLAQTIAFFIEAILKRRNLERQLEK